MNRALRTAATGMLAQQLNVDIIANNLANVNTKGFKRSKVEFQDLMYETLKPVGKSQTPNLQQPVEIQVGTGVSYVATPRSFMQGGTEPTGNSLDLAIEGEGFFQVRRPDGTLAYTRDGSFKMAADGTLVTAQGYFLDPQVSFPSEVNTISVGLDGTVEAVVLGDSLPTKVGSIELAKFVNPAGLRAVGGNLFVETPASGQPIVGTAGSQGFGEIKQGFLESSNVDIVEEMVNMIVAQRAYEINSKTIKTVEDIMTMANNLKR